MAPASRISSTSSDRVKAVRALHSRQGRRKSGRFVVEGPQAVRAALAANDAGVVIRDLFMEDDAGVVHADITAAAQEAGVGVTPADPHVLAAMGETTTSQGVLAVCDLLPEPDLDAVLAAEGPVIVLEGVADPGNVGTVIRTADAIGAAGVLLTPGSADPHNGKVVRATAGSLFHLPVATGREIDEIREAAGRHGRRLVVATGDATDDLFDAIRSGQVDSGTVWVIGSEAHGVSREARGAADLAVRIPMTGGAESLNAAVAASIVLYVTAFGATPAR